MISTTIAPTVPCVGCGAPVAGEFCAACGERRRAPGALSLRHLASEAFEHVTSLDVRLLRTFATLVRRPGEVTRAYLEGARKRYTPPLQLFLLLNVVFFLAAPRVGLFRYGISRPAAEAVVEYAAGRQQRIRVPVPEWRQLVAVARRTGWSAAELQARFNAVAEQRTRSLVSLYIAMVTLLLLLVYAWRRRYLAEHVVFATHYLTFALVYLPAVLLLTRACTALLTRWGADATAGWVASALALTLLAGLYAHLAVALRRVYGDRWLPALLRAAVVLGALAFLGSYVFYATVMDVTARSL